jgi:hypothetical protein
LKAQNDEWTATHRVGGILMSVDGPDFELPKNLERTLAMLSRIYAQEGLLTLQEIIVNSKIRIEEASTYDNWNGGTYGHVACSPKTQPI